MSALKIGNVLRAGLMAWAMFMDLNVRSGDNYVNIGQSLVGTSGAVALAALVCFSGAELGGRAPAQSGASGSVGGAVSSAFGR